MSLEHWSSYSKLVMCCVRPFGQKNFQHHTKVRVRSKSKSYTYFYTSTTSYKSTTVRTHLYTYKSTCVYEYDVLQQCWIFCTSYTCKTYKSTRFFHSNELIVVLSSKRSLAHWSSYTKLVNYVLCTTVWTKFFFFLA